MTVGLVVGVATRATSYAGCLQSLEWNPLEPGGARPDVPDLWVTGPSSARS